MCPVPNVRDGAHHMERVAAIGRYRCPSRRWAGPLLLLLLAPQPVPLKLWNIGIHTVPRLRARDPYVCLGLEPSRIVEAGSL